MKTKRLLALAAAASLITSAAGQMPEMPKPQKEHEWLKKFTGEWNTVTEIHMAPGQPPLKATGSETAEMLGGFWVIGKTKAEMMGAPFSGIMTFGFDPAKKQYIGTWVDSNTSTMWNYTGTLDTSGKILTLESKGMCPMEGKVCTFRDKIEFKSDDERVMTGTKYDEKSGAWVTKMVITATRKK